jgi:hypothetical protein
MAAMVRTGKVVATVKAGDRKESVAAWSLKGKVRE